MEKKGGLGRRQAKTNTTHWQGREAEKAKCGRAVVREAMSRRGDRGCIRWKGWIKWAGSIF